jgi:arylsulfatase A-like enzyme
MSQVTRRSFLGGIAGSAMATALPPCPGLTQTAETPTRRKPNIIYLMADDLGYGDVGCFGQRQIKTPHIDRLAAEGLRFIQAYAGAPVCAPSRCALMTGMHTGHCRIRGNSKQSLEAQDVTVAKVLKSAGYATALVGKWGLGGEGTPGVPTREGFDFFYGYIDQTMAHNYYPSFLVRNEQREKLRNVVPNEGRFGQGVASEKLEYSAALMQQEALKIIEQNKDKPFFLYYSPTLPHANNEAHAIEVPDLGIYKDKDWPTPQKEYAAAITLLDTYVGQIMQRLKRLGIDGDTIVFFTSDNGPHQEGSNDPKFFASSGPLRGIKREVYEGGIRVPMIVRWPGKVASGRTSNQVWAFWDFLPTAAELAKASAPQDIDGISVAPTIMGKPLQQTQHLYLYWEFHERGFKQAIRMGAWKAVRLGTRQPIELYDLGRDVGETKNLADQNPEVIKRMASLFTTARTDSPDWPIREP